MVPARILKSLKREGAQRERERARQMKRESEREREVIKTTVKETYRLRDQRRGE